MSTDIRKALLSAPNSPTRPSLSSSSADFLAVPSARKPSASGNQSMRQQSTSQQQHPPPAVTSTRAKSPLTPLVIPPSTAQWARTRSPTLPRSPISRRPKPEQPQQALLDLQHEFEERQKQQHHLALQQLQEETEKRQLKDRLLIAQLQQQLDTQSQQLQQLHRQTKQLFTEPTIADLTRRHDRQLAQAEENMREERARWERDRRLLETKWAQAYSDHVSAGVAGADTTVALDESRRSVQQLAGTVRGAIQHERLTGERAAELAVRLKQSLLCMNGQ